jgi:hypothetical protein
MITRQQLWDQLGKRPYQPFRVTLTDGVVIDLLRPNQAVVSRSQLIVATPDDHMRWIPLDRVARFEIFDLRPAS